jgi:hypothetical protein
VDALDLSAVDFENRKDGEHARRSVAAGDVFEIDDDAAQRGAVQHAAVEVGRPIEQLAIAGPDRLLAAESRNGRAEVEDLRVVGEQRAEALEVAPVVGFELARRRQDSSGSPLAVP